jgi:hypothetical protein
LRITADTNVPVRAAVLDDPRQADLAAEVLRDADVIAVTVSALCGVRLGDGARVQAKL